MVRSVRFEPLAYRLGTMGLRLTAAWAEAAGLASVSNVALLKQLRKTLPWLEALVGRLLGAPGDGPCILERQRPPHPPC